MHVGLIDAKWWGHHTSYVKYISQFLTEEGHRVTFVTDKRHERLDKLPNNSAFRVETTDIPQLPDGPKFTDSVRYQYGRTKQLTRLMSLVESSQLDIAHLLFFDRTQVPYYIYTLLKGRPEIPVVATLHRDQFTKQIRGNRFQRILDEVTRHAMGRSLRQNRLDGLALDGIGIKRRLAETFRTIDPVRIRYFPAPTPEPPSGVSKLEARERLGLETDNPLLLFFGGLRYDKGPDLVAEALSDLKQPLTVVFAGPPDEFTEADVEAWRAATNPPTAIENHVGFVPEDDLYLYFIAADVLLVTYRRERGISGPLRRACMTDTHIIGSDDSDIGDIIEENDLGQTCRRGSAPALRAAIIEYLDHRERYPTDGVKLYGDAHHWRESGRALEGIYRDLNEVREG